MTKLADVFDTSLGKAFEATGAGYARLARGLYAKSADGAVWHGLSVTFHRKGRRLVVQPNISAFCPAASKIRKRGLGVREHGKLGGPFVTRPVYDCVRAFCAEDRMSFDYDVEAIEDVDGATKLVHEDFLKIADKFFGSLSSARDVRDYIVSHPAFPASGINAIALSYLLDPRITGQKVDELARIRRNTMTENFVTNIKNKKAIQA